MKKKVLSVLLVAAMAMSIQGNRGSSRNDCFRRRRDTDRMVLGS